VLSFVSFSHFYKFDKVARAGEASTLSRTCLRIPNTLRLHAPVVLRLQEEAN